MSAYMVERHHIHYLIEAATSRCITGNGGALRWFWNADRAAGTIDLGEIRDRDDQEAARVGQMLWDANRESVSHRYAARASEYWPPEDYVYGAHAGRPLISVNPLQVVQACRCYAYQSCEHDGWPDSEAQAFVDALEHHAVSRLVDEDESIVWGAPNPTPRLRIRVFCPE